MEITEWIKGSKYVQFCGIVHKILYSVFEHGNAPAAFCPDKMLK